MTDIAPIMRRDDRLLRTAVFALAVLAQLLLPAMMLRADAVAGDLCVTSDDGQAGHPSKAHEHGQQCSHCLLHNSPTMAPPVAAAAAATQQARYAVRDPVLATSTSFARHAQPPPRGPPRS